MYSDGNIGNIILNDYYTTADNNEVNVLVNNVLRDMQKFLNARQLSELNKLLNKTIVNYSVTSEVIVDIDYREMNEKLINQFLKTKRLIGLAESTLTVYTDVIGYLINFHDKGLADMSSDDIREWFKYLMDTGTTARTVDNYRRYLSSFYNFCNVEGLIFHNPMKKIEGIKQPKQVKQPFSSKELVLLRNNCETLREKATFELLLSSGIRLSELTGINREDLDFNNNCFYVIGKGNKERKCYFNEAAKVAIKNYLDSRTDTNSALFISYMGTPTRLKHSGVEYSLKQVAKRAGVTDVHPHRFRRTMACNLLSKNVPLEQIRIILGHTNLETTKLYVVEDEDEINYNHRRYVN
jgi:site-specific recombinase XerD